MKKCYTGWVEGSTGTEVYPKILEQLTDDGKPISPILMIFSSDNSNFGYYSRALSSSFPSSTVIGLTSKEMLSAYGSGKTGLCVIAVTSGIEVSYGTLFQIGRFPDRSASAIEEAVSKIKTENSVCLEFNASSEYCEELVLDTFSRTLKDRIMLCGCTASVCEKSGRPSAVSLNGITYMDACVFVMIHNTCGKIASAIENIYAPTGHFFTATDVDCEARKVYEFDHKKASETVANALRVKEDRLDAISCFHPLGRRLDDETEIIGIKDIDKDGSMNFFATVYNQTKLYLMEPAEPVSTVWKNTADSIKRQIQNPSFTVIFSCFSRTRFFDTAGINKDFNDALTHEYSPYIAICGSGEQYGSRHLNQMMIVLAFE